MSHVVICHETAMLSLRLYKMWLEGPLVVMSCLLLHVKGDPTVDTFVMDIIETFHSRSPTIIFDEYAPEICFTRQWVLCVTTGPDGREKDALADYLAFLAQTMVKETDNREIVELRDGPQVKRKHDLLLFLGGGSQKELVSQIDNGLPMKLADPDTLNYTGRSDSPKMGKEKRARKLRCILSGCPLKFTDLYWSRFHLHRTRTMPEGHYAERV